MIGLQLTRLELTNHGPYGGTHRFEFPEDPVAVLIQPNESGKTTMLESLAIILWGDTNSEGKRDRHWRCGEREPHQGVVEFRRTEDDIVRQVRIQRDFDTHDVIAVELTEDGTQSELFRGKHNPAGRTQDNRLWPDDTLPGLLGAKSVGFSRQKVLVRSDTFPNPRFRAHERWVQSV